MVSLLIYPPRLKQYNFAKKITLKMKIRLSLATLSVAILCACSGGDNSYNICRTVRTMKPEAATEKNVKHFSGMVSESHDINLGFKTPGQISNIYVKEGDFVKKGALLATLDDTDYITGAEGLRAQVLQLKAEYERCKMLYEQKSMSLNDFEKIKTGYIQAMSQLKDVDNKIAYTKLYAPVSGHIRSVNFSKAEMVDVGTPVFNLLDDTAMDISLDVPYSIYRNIENISDIAAVMPMDDKAIDLQILSVVPKADGNQLYKMKLAVPSAYSKIFIPGMSVDVVISMVNQTSSNNSVRIPAHSIIRRNDSTFVWLVDADSTLIKRNVKAGEMNGDRLVTILDGIDMSDEIVVSGVNMLSEGEKVKILEKPSNTNVGGLL